MLAAISHFPSIDAAVRATIEIIQMGVPIARCELLDANAVRAVNRHDKLALRESPMLLMEFHGSDASVKEQAETVQAIAREHGGEASEWAATPEERSRLWTARHHAYFAALQTKLGCRCVTTDTCVPISRLAQCVDETVAEADASDEPYFIVGHVGDGNFHVGYLIDPAKPEERETAERLSRQLVACARARRHLHRRARHRLANRFPARRGRPGRGRADEAAQARPRPERHHEPGKIFSA